MVKQLDAIEGKGEGLTMLLHGRPSVDKTYTAGELDPSGVSWETTASLGVYLGMDCCLH